MRTRGIQRSGVGMPLKTRLVLLGAAAHLAVAPSPPALSSGGTISTLPGFPTQLQNTSLSNIRGFSYQPYFPSVGGTGAEIWGSLKVFDVASIDADFTAAKKIFPKVNMIRLWMSLDGFISNPAHYATQFNSVLALSPKHGIRFVVTIFNRWESVPNWGGQSALSGDYR